MTRRREDLTQEYSVSEIINEPGEYPSARLKGILIKNGGYQAGMEIGLLRMRLLLHSNVKYNNEKIIVS